MRSNEVWSKLSVFSIIVDFRCQPYLKKDNSGVAQLRSAEQGEATVKPRGRKGWDMVGTLKFNNLLKNMKIM